MEDTKPEYPYRIESKGHGNLWHDYHTLYFSSCQMELAKGVRNIEKARNQLRAFHFENCILPIAFFNSQAIDPPDKQYISTRLQGSQHGKSPEIIRALLFTSVLTTHRRMRLVLYIS